MNIHVFSKKFKEYVWNNFPVGHARPFVRPSKDVFWAMSVHVDNPA